MRQKLISAVHAAHESGICVVPPRTDGSKAPVSTWKEYQERRPSSEELTAWYGCGAKNTGIGWICGKISGGLEVLDFDTREIYERFKDACKYGGISYIVEKIENGYLEQSPNGVHIPYRCSSIDHNKVFAQRPMPSGKLKTIIETRGEGGFIIVSPSYGNVNSDGNYVLLQGSPSTISEITPEEREMLHDIARMLCEKPIELPRGQKVRMPGTPSGNRPGEVFARETSWSQILEPHGWIAVRTRGDTTDWRRPGKRYGISATTNHMGSDCLYVFSSNASPFEIERSYTKFGAWAELNHQGDYESAARELGTKYGIVDDNEVNIDALLDIAKRTSRPSGQSSPKKQRVFPRHLLDVPGLVGEVKDWIKATGHKPQDVLALAAGITAVATVIGRKVRMESNLRPNIYCVVIADPGDGKERMRSGVRQIFKSIGAPMRTAMERIASDSALINWVMAVPCCMLIIDEIGDWISSMTSYKSQTYQNGIIRELTSLYGVSDGTYYAKVYADTLKEGKEPVFVEEPSVSMLGVAPYAQMYSSLKSEQIHDGFISRLLIFEGEYYVPDTSYPSSTDLPNSIMTAFSKWEQFKKRDEGSDLVPEHPDPITVYCEPNATSILRTFDKYVTDHQNKLRATSGRGSDGIYARCATAARKLALIRACGRCYDPTVGPPPVIDAADAQWGVDLAWYLIDGFASSATDNMADTQHEKNINRVKSIIRLAGSNGICHSGNSGLLRRSKMKAKELNEVVLHLAETDEVSVVLVNTAKGAKSKQYYYNF